MGPLKTIEQAADWLGVPRRWLVDAVTARQVPHTRVGKHVRFADHHLEAIVAAGEQQVRNDPSPVARQEATAASVTPLQRHDDTTATGARGGAASAPRRKAS